jgi:hypothetical protein
VPLAGNRVAAERRVVTPIQGPIVVAHRVEVIDDGLALVSLLKDEGLHFEALEGEFHLISDLLRGEERRPLMTKSLQVKNQVLRGSVDFHFLEGILMLLALRAVPLVVPRENLFLAE